MAVLSDPISDFLTRLKNASLAGNEEFTAPCSNIKVEIARILQEEGYIWNYEVTGEGTKKQIKVKTKFTPQGKPVVTDVVTLGSGENHALRLAASLAARSDHPVSGAVATYWREKHGQALGEADDFESLTGRGVKGRVGGQWYYLGSHRLLQ